MRYEGNKVVISEQELKWLVNESVKNILTENAEDEGNWFSDKYNQGKAALTSLRGKDDKAGNKPSLGKRISNMRKNWGTQGQLNDLNNAIEVIAKYVNAGEINQNMTVKQLFGAVGKNGKMGQYLGNLASQISKRGGTAYNARNKQNLPLQPQK
jgi:hypothetical protein